MKNQNYTPPKLKKKATKNAAKPPCCGASFANFGGVEFWFLMLLSKEIPNLSLISVRDNIGANTTTER